jgi:hypothetical protein
MKVKLRNMDKDTSTAMRQFLKIRTQHGENTCISWRREEEDKGGEKERKK